MEELGLSGVNNLDGKLQHIAPTHPPKLQSLSVVFKSKICGIAIAGVDIVLIVCNINFIIFINNFVYVLYFLCV